MGDKSQPTVQAGRTSETEGVAGEVGALHSSEVYLGEMGRGNACRTPGGRTKGEHLLNARRRSKGRGDGRGNPDSNPE